MRTAKACCTDYTENTSFTTMPKDFRPIGRGIKHVETRHGTSLQKQIINYLSIIHHHPFDHSANLNNVNSCAINADFGCKDVARNVSTCT